MVVGHVSECTWFIKAKLTYMRWKVEIRDFLVSRKIMTS